MQEYGLEVESSFIGFYLVVGHGVVPVEEAWGDEIRHHYVYAVMLMCYQDADHAHRA